MKEAVTVHCFPISGGYFVNQVAACITLIRSFHIKPPPVLVDLTDPTEKRYVVKEMPELILGSSGGNVTAYLACASGWDETQLWTLLRKMSPSMFAEPWDIQRFLPGKLGLLVTAIFKKSMYRTPKSEYCTSFFETVMPPHLHDRYEIWTGTDNKDLDRAQMFCNQSEGRARLKRTDEGDLLLGTLPPIYMEGDVVAMSKASLASASIPVVVSPQTINGHLHMDGGCSFPDPFLPLSNRIRKHAHMKPLHIVTFQGVDPYRSTSEMYVKQIYGDGFHAISRMQTSMILQSRLAALNMIRNPNAELHEEEGECTPIFFYTLHQRQEQTIWRSLLEIYPTEVYNVNIVSFKTEELLSSIQKSMSSLRYRLFWSEE